MAQIEGGQMLHIRQIVQSDLLGMELINVAYDTADAVYGYLVAGLEIYHNVVFEGKEIEIFIDIFDDVHHHVGAFGPVVESLDGILKKDLQELLP
jgi:hypothetical protein